MDNLGRLVIYFEFLKSNSSNSQINSLTINTLISNLTSVALSEPLTIHSFLADSQKHAVTPIEPTTRARASTSTTEGSAFHTSSPKPTWIINSGATDHIKFDPSQLISRKSTTLSVVPNANGTASSMVRECDTCELAKSHCILFSLSTNKSLVPFSLIHSDV
ncbi:unnamed protein product [Prunus brigantina]